MSKKRLIILLIATLSFSDFATAQTWERLTNVPTQNCLADVEFIDTNNGWVAGCNGTILHTTDGGSSWTLQNSGTSSGLNALTFVDSAYGWAAGGTGWPHETGFVIHTTDGGQTWSLQDIQSTHFAMDVRFTDRRNGWVLRYWGTLLHSTDGGATWLEQSTGVQARLDEESFVDSLHGWAAGQFGSIIHTSDGGTQWSLQQSGSTAWVMGLSSVDSQYGWAAGDSGIIRRTTDGGSSWLSQTVGTNEYFEDIAFANRRYGWVVSAFGRVYHTTDGGVTWRMQTAGSGAELWSITCVDQEHVWAVGDNGTILQYRWTLPDTVTGLVATSDRCDSVLLMWNDVENDTIYHVYRDAIEIGSTPRDVTQFWDHPSPGNRTYCVRAENSLGFGAPSATTIGRIRPLIVISAGTPPDTVHSGETTVVYLNHCGAVTTDSVFLSLDNNPPFFVCAFAPPVDTCNLTLPDTIHGSHTDCYLKIVAYRETRSDTLVIGVFVLEGVNSSELFTSAITTEFFLSAAYPNPFNPSTTLRFGVPRASHVSLDIFDMLGRKTQTLLSGVMQPGEHEVVWNCLTCPSGMYFVRMQAGGQSLQRKVMLLK